MLVRRQTGSEGQHFLTTVLRVDDSTLATALAVRDPHALDEAYRRYADRLLAYAHSLVGDRDSAADIVQDTFLLASQHASQLRDPARLRPWLYAIARHVGMRQLRLRAKVRPVMTEEFADRPADSTDPLANMRAAEIVELVWAAYEGMPDGDREIVELSVRHGLSSNDIADMLDVSVKHANARLSRARASLADALGVLLVARSQTSCQELTDLLQDWDGKLTPLLRKRLHRHIEACESCGEVRSQRMDPVALLSAYTSLPFAASPLIAQPGGADPLTAQAPGLDPTPAQPGTQPDGPGQSAPPQTPDAATDPARATPDPGQGATAPQGPDAIPNPGGVRPDNTHAAPAQPDGPGTTVGQPAQPNTPGQGAPAQQGGATNARPAKPGAGGDLAGQTGAAGPAAAKPSTTGDLAGRREGSGQGANGRTQSGAVVAADATIQLPKVTDGGLSIIAGRLEVQEPRWDAVTGFPRQPRSRRPMLIAAALLLLALCGSASLILPGTPDWRSTPSALPTGTASGDPEPTLSPSASPSASPSPSPSLSPSPVVSTKPPPSPNKPSLPPPPPPPIRLDLNVSLRCVAGNEFVIDAEAEADTRLAKATLYWRRGFQTKNKPMILSADKEEAEVLAADTSTLPSIRYWVDVTAVDGRTLRTSTTTAANPCN